MLVADALLGEGLSSRATRSTSGSTASRRTSPPPSPPAGPPTATRADAAALVAVFVPPLAMPGDAYARALREAVAGQVADKPVVAVFLAAEGMPAELAVLGEDGTPGRGSVPSYASPERAVAALGAGEPLRALARRPAGDFAPPPGIDGDAARELVARCDVGIGATAAAHGAVAASSAGGCWTTRSATALLALLRHHAASVRRVGGRGRRPWPPPRSSATPSRSRPPASGGGTAPTSSACASTS